MTVSRPPDLRPGTEIRLGEVHYTVTVVSGTAVEMVDASGCGFVVEQAVLFADPGFVVADTARAPLPAQEVLDGFAPDVAEQARWWEYHLVEVLSGVPPQSGPGAEPRPEYDTATRTLRQREVAKVAELAEAGNRVPLRKFQRMRHSYETEGLLGLVDGRTSGRRASRIDERVVAAVRSAVAGETDRSTGTVSRLRRRVEKILAAEHGLTPTEVAEMMPSKATFYRLAQRISAGKHTFGSARTRRSAAKSPAGPFGSRSALRPGEWMLIDSSPLNIMVVLDNGLTDRVDLTWIIDQATRSVPAAVLRPSTKAVDAALLLARCLTPEPMRPGWTEALRMSRSVLPHRRLTGIDERLEHAAARPVIVPETIVTDHGKVFVSATFRNACRAMGINFQPTHEGSPWEKGTVEASFRPVDTLFAQYVAGYVGNSVEHRGRDPEAEAVWSMLELQEMLDEWLVAQWAVREHDGLRDALMPGKALSPNEKYATLVETAGYVPVPLSAEDYIELLPACWRAINTYGLKISHRKYDCKALNPYRRQHSGVTAKRGLWEVHRDPYDVSRIWVRNHHDGGWIMAPWTHLKSAPVPFGEQAWEHGRQILAQRGRDKVTETEIAATVTALLDKAEQGPEGPRRTKATTKDRKVAARTRATSAATSKRPGAPEPPPEPTTPPPEESRKARRAKVIPLPIFNAHEEALKRW